MEYTDDVGKRKSKCTRARSLIRAARRGRPRDNDENIEDDPERSGTKDGACDSHVNFPKVEGQSTTEQQERNLQHKWQGLHHMVKVPSDDTVQFPLAVLAAFYGGPSHVSRRVSIQPLFAEHREERRKKGDSETGVQYGLDMDDRLRRAGPLRNRRNFVTKSGVVHLVKENSQESGGLFAWVWLESRVDLNDEGRSNGGEQTGLGFKSANAYPSDMYNLRISTLYSDPRHGSSEIPCRTPLPACDNAHRIEHENPPVAAPRLPPFYTRDE